MTVLLRLIALVLFLVAFLSGGCSLLFTAFVFTEPAGGAILLIVLTGFALGGFCLWAGLALWRKARKSTAPPDPDTFR